MRWNTVAVIQLCSLFCLLSFYNIILFKCSFLLYHYAPFLHTYYIHITHFIPFFIASCKYVPNLCIKYICILVCPYLCVQLSILKCVVGNLLAHFVELKSITAYSSIDCSTDGQLVNIYRHKQPYSIYIYILV